MGKSHKVKYEYRDSTEMLDLVVVDGLARGIVVRDLVTGEIRSHGAESVVLATGGYSNAYFLSTNAIGCNVTAAAAFPREIQFSFRFRF